MMARLAAILASCAFDPNHPNAPCNDQVGPPLLEPALWALVIVCVLVAIWLLLRHSRSG